jgi:multiple sugar transport system substrate-binding protein
MKPKGGKQMKKKGIIFLLGLIVVLSGWWVLYGNSDGQPSEGVIDVWVTWGDDAEPLQALFDGYGSSNDSPVKVTTRIRDDDLLEALADGEPPDLVILSAGDPVASYHEQGLVEPLDGWIEAGGIDLDDIYPAPLAQCQGRDGTTLCLPWGCDVDALFWNKDLFAAAGLDPERPPQTLEELAEYASRLTVYDEEGGLAQVGFMPDLPRSHLELYAHMFGGAFYRDGGAELAANSQAVIDALAWQMQVYDIYTSEKLEDFVPSFTPYMTSHHPLYAGRRLSCQQCHRSLPIQNNKTPDIGFYEGKMAMMIDGQWQVGPNALSQEGSQVNYGVALFPAPAAYPERANSAVVRGPVVIVPAGARDREAAGQLLAWMMSPEIVAEAAYANSALPTSRTAGRDPRFQEMAGFGVFVDLMAHANARPSRTTPISAELNEALGDAEADLLQGGGDPVLLLNEIQAELSTEWMAVLSESGGP